MHVNQNLITFFLSMYLLFNTYIYVERYHTNAKKTRQIFWHDLKSWLEKTLKGKQCKVMT